MQWGWYVAGHKISECNNAPYAAFSPKWDLYYFLKHDFSKSVEYHKILVFLLLFWPGGIKIRNWMYSWDNMGYEVFSSKLIDITYRNKAFYFPFLVLKSVGSSFTDSLHPETPKQKPVEGDSCPAVWWVLWSRKCSLVSCLQTILGLALKLTLP